MPVLPQLQALWGFLQWELPLWSLILPVLVIIAATKNWCVFKFLVGLAAPVLNDRRTSISLGRFSFFGLLTAIIWLFLAKPSEFSAMGWPPAMILILLNLFLLVYCFGQKPEIQEMGKRIAAGVTFGGAARELVSDTVHSATVAVQATMQEKTGLPAEPVETEEDYRPEPGSG